MNENQHAPCPFCGGTDLTEFDSQGLNAVVAGIICGERKCHARGPVRTAATVKKAIAAAWEAWDAAGKRGMENENE